MRLSTSSTATTTTANQSIQEIRCLTRLVGLDAFGVYTIEGDDAKTFVAEGDGKANVSLSLKDYQEITVKDLPKGATYKITEKASDHVADYRIESEDMPDDVIIRRLKDTNAAESAKALSTELERVNLADSTVVVLWTNNRDIATTTAARTHTGIRAGAFAALLAMLAALIARRRKLTEEVKRAEQ